MRNRIGIPTGRCVLVGKWERKNGKRTTAFPSLVLLRFGSKPCVLMMFPIFECSYKNWRGFIDLVIGLNLRNLHEIRRSNGFVAGRILPKSGSENEQKLKRKKKINFDFLAPFFLLFYTLKPSTNYSIFKIKTKHLKRLLKTTFEHNGRYDYNFRSARNGSARIE